jgi:hypothetical protein
MLDALTGLAQQNRLSLTEQAWAETPVYDRAAQVRRIFQTRQVDG